MAESKLDEKAREAAVRAFRGPSEATVGAPDADLDRALLAYLAARRDEWDASNAVRLCDRCDAEQGAGSADPGDRACSACGQHEAHHVYLPLAAVSEGQEAPGKSFARISDPSSNNPSSPEPIQDDERLVEKVARAIMETSDEWPLPPLDLDAARAARAAVREHQGREGLDDGGLYLRLSRHDADVVRWRLRATRPDHGDFMAAQAIADVLSAKLSEGGTE